MRVDAASGLAPLIVTATMGAADQAWADDLRRAHFPPERNFLKAHITLFHHLPPARLAELARRLTEECRSGPPRARLAGVRFLGRGVAFDVESPDLLAIRERIADAFAADLVPQDRQRPRLHITVQNKVEPAVARTLHAELSVGFAPRPLAIAGLAAWHYRGGPWEPAGRWQFRGKAA
jgi:hypothetical protein